MQKTVLFGINAHNHQQNVKQIEQLYCHNCLKLQKQLDQLNLLLSQKSQNNIDEGINQPAENQTTKLLQIQLEDIKQKYLAFRKKVKLIEKESQSLFDENTKLQKEIQVCRLRLRDLQNQKAYSRQFQSNQKAEKTLKDVSNQKESKKLQIQLFVWQQKVEKLEVILKNQSEEASRLKELLKKRNRLQEERHKLLSVFV